MGLHPHYLPELILSFTSIAIAFAVALLVRRWPSRPRSIAWSILLLLSVLIGFTGLLAAVRVARLFPAPFVTWFRCLGLVASALVVYSFVIIGVLRSTGAFRPERRRFLRASAAAAIAAPAAVGGFAIVRRENLIFREVDLRLPSIPRELDGLRIVQLSDIHLSPFVSESLLARAVGVANDTNAHIAVVTGDLISIKGDPLDVCLNHLAALRAESGVYGCMGNHEVYAGALGYVDRAASLFGMKFLRGESVLLPFGGARVALAGVDYQVRNRPYLQGAESLVAPEAFNILLSHNPEVFPVAARKNFDLTLAGHTHGGQVNFEMLHPSLNVVNFTANFVYGVYEELGRKMYVTRGIGTIGVPARLGAPPEVVLIRLCAT
jgi:hypothetical protein